MTRISRRSLLRAAGAGLGALVAGSLSLRPLKALFQTLPDATLADLAAYYSSLR